MSYLRNHCRGYPLASEATVDAYYGEIHNSSIGTLRTRMKFLCFSHEKLRAELTGLEIVHNDTTNEVASILKILDTLRHQEDSFRICRDRLRKLVGEQK